MIDLAQRAEPYELELPYGLRVTVRPLTTAGMAAAQAAARLRSRRSSGRRASARKRGCRLAGSPTSQLKASAMASTRRS
jgi:hypothetical protein